MRQAKGKYSKDSGEVRGMKFNQALRKKNAYRGQDRYTAAIVVESFLQSPASLALSQAPFPSP